jgi:hypothetical protein
MSTKVFKHTKRECQIPCYVAHTKPNNITFIKWSTHYEEELLELFKILGDVFGSDCRYKSYESFARLIYGASSKHLI